MNSKGKPFGICPICCGIFVVWGWQILGRCDDWRLIGCFGKHPTESQKNGEKLQQGKKWLGKCSPNKKCVHEMQNFPHKHSSPWKVFLKIYIRKMKIFFDSLLFSINLDLKSGFLWISLETLGNDSKILVGKARFANTPVWLQVFLLPERRLE